MQATLVQKDERKLIAHAIAVRLAREGGETKNPDLRRKCFELAIAHAAQAEGRKARSIVSIRR